MGGGGKGTCLYDAPPLLFQVGQIEWHPSAANVLASASSDLKIIIWNTESGEDLFTMEVHKDMIYCMSWNYDGSLLATTSKDKKLRIINPRKRVVIRVWRVCVCVCVHVCAFTCIPL